MKNKWIIVGLAAATAAACGKQTPAPPAQSTAPAATEAPGAVSAPAQSTPPSTTPAADGSAAALSTNGLDLARKSGCLACHSIEKKIVGPAWKDVAARYKNDANAKAALIDKIKKGGKGNWTDVTGGTPMPPYSPRVSDADIEALVNFVLAL